MKDLQKDLKMIISTKISETEKDEWIEKLVNGYIEQQKVLIIDGVSQQRELFSLDDMKKAFEEGEKHKYECSANGKDKKCYCKNDNDCNWRNYQTFEDWFKEYTLPI